MGKNGDIPKNGMLVSKKVKILVERWNSKGSKKPPVLKTFWRSLSKLDFHSEIPKG